MKTLYKYTTINGALAILKGNSIGFSNAESLNDPFELRGGEYRTVLDKIDGINALINNLSRNFGILSLTRTYLNPIMWSLYSDQHKGAVVAIDVEKSEFNKCSFIPASKGNVIYSKTHPGNVFYAKQNDLSDIRNMCKKHFYEDLNEDEINLASMFFLHKSNWWYHEEEVRVVKNIENSGSHHFEEDRPYSNQSGKWVKTQVNGRPLHCLSLPQSSITHIYLGACTGQHYGSRTDAHQEMVKQFISFGVPVSAVKIKNKSWELQDGCCYGDDGKRIIDKC